MTESQKTSHPTGGTVVIGDGWAALGAVALLAKAGRQVDWLPGSGAHFAAPLPSLEDSDEVPGIRSWRRVAEAVGLSADDLGEELSGSFLREFRNKAFREPAWLRSPTPESRAETQRELLWAPETRIAPVFEARFSQTLGEIEAMIRERLLSGEVPNVRRHDAIPVSGFRIEKGLVEAVLLSNGEEIATHDVIYADRWATLPTLTGLPKPIPFTRGRVAGGVIQAVFKHGTPMGVGVMEGFYGVLNKDPGEEIERHVWGGFSSDGKASTWTICLSPEEVEDNHLIAKKLRRMKNALDKMFTGTEWLPEGKGEFNANVTSESVRFEAATLFSEGEEVLVPQGLKGASGLQFLTDGFGPARAMVQAGALVPDSAPKVGAKSEGEGAQVVDPGTF